MVKLKFLVRISLGLAGNRNHLQLHDYVYGTPLIMPVDCNKSCLKLAGNK